MTDRKNVALVGADGKLGPHILNSLVSSGKFTVTVLKRASSTSKSEYPSSVQVTTISDDFPIDELVTALRGKDAIVVTVTPKLNELQNRLADAAAQAGVKQFIPADFGSCDSQDDIVCKALPLYAGKTGVREHLQGLVSRNAGFSWTSVVCGHFFEDFDFMHIDVKGRSAVILDDGETRASTSSFGQIGASVVKILEMGGVEEVRNRVLYVQSFCVTQNQVVAAVERATGQEFKVERVESQKFFEEMRAKSAAGDKKAIEEVVWVLGTRYANWEEREGFANGLLGLKEENIDEVVKKIVA